MTLPTSRRAALELLAVSLLFVSPVLQAQEINSVWVGPVGNWNEGKKWSTAPDFPNNRHGQTYSAFLNSGDVTLNQAVTVEQLVLGAAGAPTLRGVTNGSRDNSLSVRSDFGLKQGLLTGTATLNALGTASISGNSNLYGWHLTLAGYTRWSGRMGVGNAGIVDNLPGGVLNFSSGAICTFYSPDFGNPYGRFRTLNNHGTINSSGGNTIDITLNNTGAINVNSGVLILAGGGTNSGPISLANGATLDFEDTGLSTGSNYVFTPNASISGNGSVKFNSSTNMAFGGVYDVTGATTVRGSISFPAPISNLGTSLVLNGQFASCNLSSNSVSVSSFYLRSGALTGNGIVTVNGPLEWNEGSMLGGGTMNAQEGVFFNGLTGSMGFNVLDRTLNCYGSSSVQTTLDYMGHLNFGLNAALNIMPGATFNASRLGISGSSSGNQNNGVVTNYGTLLIDNPGLNRGMGVFGTAFVNQGIIQITNSKLDVRSSVNSPAFVQNAGSVRLQNGTLACDRSNITSGSLSGYGYVGNLVSNGLIAPSAGTLNFSNSSLTLQSNSVLAYDLNGTMPGVSFGQIVNVSIAALDGELQVTLSEAFQSQVQSSDTFTLLTAQSINGQFANVGNGARLTTADGSGSFVVTYSGNSLVLSNFLATTFPR